MRQRIPASLMPRNNTNGCRRELAGLVERLRMQYHHTSMNRYQMSHSRHRCGRRASGFSVALPTGETSILGGTSRWKGRSKGNGGPLERDRAFLVERQTDWIV